VAARGEVSDEGNEPSAAQGMQERVLKGLSRCLLLPALQLTVATLAICIQLWGVLSAAVLRALQAVRQVGRGRGRGGWREGGGEGEGGEGAVMLRGAREFARLDTRRTLKRLSKETLKQTGKLLAKLAHSDPPDRHAHPPQCK